MRWLIFLLLWEGFLFNVSAFDPASAGEAGWLWPFAADSKTIMGFIGGLPGQPGGAVASLLAGIAGISFFTALITLFWKNFSPKWWRMLVLTAVVVSAMLYGLFFSARMTAPILVDMFLLWGVLTKRWSVDALRMRTSSDVPVPIYPLMHFPVPWVFVLSYLAGAGLQFLLPISIHLSALARFGRIVGIVFATAGGLLAFSSLGIFHKVRTTTVPFETASQLVTWGAYRLTRNPMYVGLTLIYLGLAAMLGQLWPLLVLPLLLFYVHKIVIPVEETLLRQAFGSAYDQYYARVSRWL